MQEFVSLYNKHSQTFVIISAGVRKGQYPVSNILQPLTILQSRHCC